MQGRQILERHLVVADRVYTIAELKRLGNESFTLPSLRDQLKLRLKESDQSKLTQILSAYFHLTLKININITICLNFI